MSDEQSVFINQSIAKHNEYRRKHGAPNLKHNPELSRVALNWARNIASRNTMQHSNCDFGGKRMGENIAMFSPSLANGNNGAYATKMWYDEIEDYNFSRPGFTGGVGHFTQVVWKASNEVGFGLAQSSNGSYYVVANYYPAGNFQGQFPQNVLPLGQYPVNNDDKEESLFSYDTLRQVFAFKNMHLASCDSCKGPIFGSRYKCDECNNYDLCSFCVKSGYHLEHELKLIDKPAQSGKYDEKVFNCVKEIFAFKYLQNSVCDICSGPIFGKKYNCQICENYDLCEQCKESGAHSEHEFKVCEKAAPAAVINNANFGKLKKVHSFKSVHNVVCDSCSRPVFGNRYKCEICSNYDLCKQCKTKGVHMNHSIQKVD